MIHELGNTECRYPPVSIQLYELYVLYVIEAETQRTRQIFDNHFPNQASI